MISPEGAMHIPRVLQYTRYIIIYAPSQFHNDTTFLAERLYSSELQTDLGPTLASVCRRNTVCNVSPPLRSWGVSPSAHQHPSSCSHTGVWSAWQKQNKEAFFPTADSLTNDVGLPCRSSNKVNIDFSFPCERHWIIFFHLHFLRCWDMCREPG